jgi:hypothetical protein
MLHVVTSVHHGMLVIQAQIMLQSRLLGQANHHNVNYTVQLNFFQKAPHLLFCFEVWLQFAPRPLQPVEYVVGLARHLGVAALLFVMKTNLGEAAGSV